MNRPIGVTLIAIWYIIIGIVLVLGGISLVALAGLAEGGYIPGLGDFPYLGVILALGGAIAIIFIIIAVVEFIIAWGLLGGKGWAWTLTIVLTFLAIALEVLSLTGGVGAFTIIGLAINALIIYYLFRPNIKAFFRKGPAEAYPPPSTYQASQTPGVPPPPPQGVAQNTCPNCGQPLTWIEQYQRWYCYNCQRYA